MSVKSQQANMKAIHSLLQQDLGYIWGERESCIFQKNGPLVRKKRTTSLRKKDHISITTGPPVIRVS